MTNAAMIDQPFLVPIEGVFVQAGQQ